MRLVLPTLGALFVAACALDEVIPPPHGLLQDDLVGKYTGHGHLSDLELKADGSYTCFIFNGITDDGCASFEGAGYSQGTWEYKDSRISFWDPDESADLVVKLSGSSAQHSEEGLLVITGGEEHVVSRLPIQLEQSNPAMQTDRATPDR
jgi:hypothetical protein